MIIYLNCNNKMSESVYDELEQLLSQYRDEVQLISADDANANELINRQLRDIGMALVIVDNNVDQHIRVMTGVNVANTFDTLTEATKQALRQGNFVLFSKEWNKRKYDDLRIAYKSVRMPQLPPVEISERKKLTHPKTDTVHVKNVLNALNNVQLWEYLSTRNPMIAPRKWFTGALKPADYRTQVSEDGIKVTNYSTYTPTGLHYDGQLGQGDSPDSRRIQIVYCSDTGPIRLFCVPGSHHARVREIVQHITGVAGTPHFATLKFDKHPKLHRIFMKYGVALPVGGLLMFRANVYHYEAAQPDTKNAPSPVAPVYTNPLLDNVDKLVEYTKNGSVFRVYCGVVSVPPRDLIADMIILAYLRESHWSMEVNKSANHHELFVNEKGGPIFILKPRYIITDELLNEFDLLAHGLSRDNMKADLQGLSDEILALYGLLRSDLETAEPIIDSSPEYTAIRTPLNLRIIPPLPPSYTEGLKGTEGPKGTKRYKTDDI